MASGFHLRSGETTCSAVIIRQISPSSQPQHALLAVAFSSRIEFDEVLLQCIASGEHNIRVMRCFVQAVRDCDCDGDDDDDDDDCVIKKLCAAHSSILNPLLNSFSIGWRQLARNIIIKYSRNWQ